MLTRIGSMERLCAPAVMNSLLLNVE